MGRWYGQWRQDMSWLLIIWFGLNACFSSSRMLTLGGGLPHLEHLNLSGCLTVTGAGLQNLVSVCPSLNDEHFYYCDNINGNVFWIKCLVTLVGLVGPLECSDLKAPFVPAAGRSSVSCRLLCWSIIPLSRHRFMFENWFWINECYELCYLRTNTCVE